MSDEHLLRECDVHTYRASGPGGQKRNKIESAVRINHPASKLTVVATESRSQHDNRRRALKRLRKSIALHIRQDLDPAGFRLAGNLQAVVSSPSWPRVSSKLPEYLPLVGVVLDLLAACAGRLSDAARGLGVSTGSLSGFITRDTKLHAAANGLRAQAGLKPLR